MKFGVDEKKIFVQKVFKKKFSHPDLRLNVVFAVEHVTVRQIPKFDFFANFDGNCDGQ